ncbi:MAG TPA: histidine kinase [Chryseosolibacter sp.]
MARTPVSIKKLKKINILLWVSVTIYVYTIDKVIVSLKGEPLYLVASLIYISQRWLSWIPATNMIVRYSLKYPLFERGFEFKFKRHFLRATVFALVMCLAEFVILSLYTYVMTLTEPDLNLKALLGVLGGWVLTGVFNRYIIYFFIAALVTSFVHLRHRHRSELETEQMRGKLVQSKLQALQMQIQPHFLFNTHQAIIGLLMKGHSQEAISMISSLSTLLRTTLDVSNEQLVPLSKEITIVSEYLKIQRVRFSDRLNVKIEVADQLAHAGVPPFILQPLVENSIQHGLGVNRSDEFLITVIADADGDRLRISVIDDGRGLVHNGESQKKGIGLKNIQSRLAALYSDDYRMSLRNIQPRGVEVAMDLPLVQL